jgi:hypothetical protein
VKTSSLEDSNLEQDIAELRKKMQKMPTSFIDDDQLIPRVNLADPEYCSLKNSKRGKCCCQLHCEWKTHFNLKYKFEADVDPFHRTVELVVSAWEELETYRWDTEDLWDNHINIDAVLGMGQP